VTADDRALQRQAAPRLLALADAVTPLGAAFAAAGVELFLVGGCVRDAVLGRPIGDLDFTTAALPDEVAGIVAPLADAVWDIGREFGTIGARIGEHTCEITTFRADRYDPGSRKPAVRFGDSLTADLRRRDFTVNAMAVAWPSLEFMDPFDGLSDLQRGLLRTPAPPAESFTDDPLRMLRAARFASALQFDVDPDAVTAIEVHAERLKIVSAERIRDEFAKLMMTRHPRRGLELLVSTGLVEHFLPELSALRLEVDEHHRHKDVYQHTLTVVEQAIDLEPDGPDLVLRLAALLHDIGKPRTRRFEPGGGVSFHHHEVVGARMTVKRLSALRFEKQTVSAVARLVELHLRFHGYADGEWTDSAVRRYVRDAGELLPRLHRLTRADCTTRNRRKAHALSQAYDSLEQRIDDLAEQEELAAIRPDLDGNQIMQILGIGSGKVVGDAYRYLLELRLDKGPMRHDDAVAALRAWWDARSAE